MGEIQQPSSIELFSGCGGLALGMSRAGLHHKALVEIDKDSAATLRHNNPEWNVYERDIREIDFTTLSGVDVVAGGFPCQAFSHAGARRGFADPRGTLFEEFARAIRETQPKIFIAENVQGLRTHDNGMTLRTILHHFEELGYSVAFRVLNTNDYGVPQSRKRTVIVGVRDNHPILFPGARHWGHTLRMALRDCPVSEGANYSQKQREVYDLVPSGANWRALPEAVQRSYMGKAFTSGGGKTGIARRLDWNKPSPTLVCSPTQKITGFCHPDETRPLTVREYARIQTFPDSYEFIGSTPSQYRQIGNAVPVKFAERLGVAALAMLRRDCTGFLIGGLHLSDLDENTGDIIQSADPLIVFTSREEKDPTEKEVL